MDEELFSLCYKGIQTDEGNRLKPYIDTVGKITIGIGRNLTDRGISDEESSFLFKNDINLVYSQLSYYEWFNSLDLVRKYVVMNMCFNLGIHGLLSFEKFIGYLISKDYLSASSEMLKSKWSTQVKNRALRLSLQMKEGIIQ